MNYKAVPKYCDSASILLINSTGQLRRLYCPFRVRCKTTIDPFKPGMWVWVEEVAIDSRDQLLYIIFDRPFPYHHFEIKIGF